MAGFLNAVSACLVLLMLMAVGYFMGVWGWMTAAEKKFISKFKTWRRNRWYRYCNTELCNQGYRC